MLLEEFIQELQRQDVSTNTIKAYKTDIKQFHKWLLETLDEDTDNITETDIKEYRQYLHNIKKFKVTSTNRKLKSVVRYQNYLNDIGESKNCVHVKDVLQKNNIEQEPEVKIVGKNDLYRLKRTIEACGNKRDIAIYYILFGTGIRVSELVNLELDDVYLTERNGKNNYSNILVRNGKGNKSREIPLNIEVVNSIKEYFKVRPVTKSKKLIIGQRGVYTRIGVNKLLERYSHQAQLRYIVTPHMARHTAFTTMIKKGVDVKTVSQLAGHSSTDVTYKYYVATTIEDKLNAVDKLEL